MDGEVYAWHRWQGLSLAEIISVMSFSRVEERLTLWPVQFPDVAAVETQGRAIERDVRQFLAVLTPTSLEETVS